MKYTSEEIITQGDKAYRVTRSLETNAPTIQLSDGQLYFAPSESAKARFRADRVRALRLFCLNSPEKINHDDWEGSVGWWVKQYWGTGGLYEYDVHLLGLSSWVPGANAYGVEFGREPVKTLELILEFYGCSVDGEVDAIKEALPG
jgi:hypothetical protein